MDKGENVTRKANYFKLGLFVIIASILGAVFLIVFGAGNFLKKELLAETCFNESVQGLNIGSEVKYKGIKIGTIKAIKSAAQVYKTKSDYVLVVFSVEKGTFLGQTGESAKERVLNAIHDGLTIQLAYKGLTGAAYLETDYSSVSSNHTPAISWSPENIYIPSHRSNIKQFADSINQILDNLTAINVKGITKDLESILNNLNSKLNNIDVEQILTLTSSLLKELKSTNAKLNSAFNPVKIKNIIDDAHSSFAELKTIIKESKTPLKNAIDDFQKAAGNTKNLTDEFQTNFAPSLDSLSSNLDRFMGNLSSTSELLENMVWINSDKVKIIIQNLETTSQNLKQLSKDIKNYPGRLLFEKPPRQINMESQK
jgi:ABC-type transporter Mla subunit MlaD